MNSPVSVVISKSDILRIQKGIEISTIDHLAEVATQSITLSKRRRWRNASSVGNIISIIIININDTSGSGGGITTKEGDIRRGGIEREGIKEEGNNERGIEFGVAIGPVSDVEDGGGIQVDRRGVIF